jgi:coenzyme Q-binding protein COQ10
MPSFQSKQRVDHSADEMFDLVADVERYSQFVPLCLRNVIRAHETRVETEVLTTEMTVAYSLFRETFRSRVTLDRANRRILVESTDGPLRRLRTEWTFQSRTESSCDVGFYLSYELASRTLALLMGGVFDAAFRRLAHCLPTPRRCCVWAPARRIFAGASTPQARAPQPYPRINFLIAVRLGWAERRSSGTAPTVLSAGMAETSLTCACNSARVVDLNQ